MDADSFAIAHAELAASGDPGDTQNFTPGNFTHLDGTALSSADAGIIRSIIHSDDVDITRTGDPDGDGTFAITQQLQSEGGAGEVEETAFIFTETAGIEVANDANAVNDVVMIAEQVPAGIVWVEQEAGVAAGDEVARTTGARGVMEVVIEAISSGAFDVVRRFDATDDGTFDVEAVIDSTVGAETLTGLWLPMVDHAGRSNPAMQTAVVNDTSQARDIMLLGVAPGVA